MAIDIKAILTAVDNTGAGFNSMKKNIAGVSAGARRLTGILAGLGATLTVGALAAFAKSGIDAADALNDMSQRTGVAVKTLAEYRLAATLADTSLDDLAKGIQRLTLSQGQAEKGGKAQADALRRLGVSAKDPQIAFEQLADAVASSNNPTQLAVDLNSLLGRSYVNLLPLLQGGSQALRESAEASGSFADAMVKLAPEAAKLNDQLDLLKINAAGVAGEMIANLVPVLNEVFERIGLVKRLIGAGGLFNTLVNTAGTDDIGVVMQRVRGEIELTQQAIDGKKSRGLDSSAFEAKLSGLNAQLQILIANRTKALMAPPDTETNRAIKADRASIKGVPVNLSDSEARAAAARAAALAAAEAKALTAALEKLDEARLTAEAQRLESGLDERRALLDQRRKAELVSESDFIAAKAALDEEGLRNELAALIDQQAKLRAASADLKAKGSERTNALAELALVEARIGSAQSKILSVAQAATAELTQLGANKLKAQLDFIDGLEKEAFLSTLNNDERETALLLLEAEKLGITDVNRLLELQGAIRKSANDAKAAEETKRQQDDLYKSVQEGVQRAFADGLNAIATGEGGIRGALKNIADTIRNAMSNAIAGSLADQFLNSSLIGGKEGVLSIAGSLGFGGKKDGSTPGSALFVKDVGAGGLAGAVGGGGAEGGGLFDGFFESIKGWFSQLTSGLGSFFSGLLNSLSGLFSSGGGGGGGGGSNVSGWVSAIASLFGYAEGGYTGAGGKYEPKGIVHGGEWVSTQAEVGYFGLPFFQALSAVARGGGFMPPSIPRTSYADGGLVDLPSAGSAGATVNANTRIVNMFDLDSAMSEFMKTRSGERAILNIIQRNPSAVGA